MTIIPLYAEGWLCSHCVLLLPHFSYLRLKEQFMQKSKLSQCLLTPMLKGSWAKFLGPKIITGAQNVSTRQAEPKC